MKLKNLKALGVAAVAVALSLSMVACSSEEATTTETTTDAVVEDVVEEATEESGAAAMGFGLISTAGEGEGSATANTTIAAVLVDESGAIVDLYIDVAQNYVYSEAGVVTTPDEYLTKQEKLDTYGMGDYSTLEEGEWYQQQAYLMEYMIGMTAADVAAIGYDDSNYPTDEDVLAGCTIKIVDYVSVVLLAMEDATEYTCTVDDTLTLVASSTASVTDAGTETDEAGAPSDGSAQVDTTIAALAVGTDGIVNDVYIDVVQSKFTITAEDVIMGAGETLSKQQLLDDYGMASYSTLEEGEWYQQQAVFMAYVVGMEASELGNIEYDAETTYAVDEDLYAGCTIKISSYVAILAKAAG